MKKYLIFLIAALLTAFSLSACGSASADTAGTAASPDSSGASGVGNDGSFQIVTTIFPEYDWVMNVLGDNPGGAEVTMLLDNGVDLHSFQPSAEDILKISTCDLFVYVGGESDEWVDETLQEAANKDMAVVNLMDVLGDAVREEEMVEGMQAGEHEHHHDEEDEHEHEDEHDQEHENLSEEEHEELHEEEHGDEEHDHEHEAGEVEYDEHVWLSLRNASVLTEAIADALCTIDPDNATAYRDNAAAYTEKLAALDGDYEAAVSAAPVKTLLFGDRFPFRYFVDDYGLDYYAAFIGCSAETEASFETVTFLADKVDELSLHCVMTIEGTDHRIAETIVQNTDSKDQQILTMDSMQSTTAQDVAGGATYLTIMEKNLEVLKEALK